MVKQRRLRRELGELTIIIKMEDIYEKEQESTGFWVIKKNGVVIIRVMNNQTESVDYILNALQVYSNFK